MNSGIEEAAADRRQTRALDVAIVVDWAKTSRASYWDEALDSLNRSGVRLRHVKYPLSDSIGALTAGGRSTLACLRDSDVIILNWDVINGDPDFGADLCFRWFEHRTLDILNWVSDGGLLIVEGQANLAVGSQRSYDALVGGREFDVSRPENSLNPKEQGKRSGGQCVVAPRAAALESFRHLDRLSPDPEGHLNFDGMFPGSAGKMLSPYLRNVRWNILYRGWIRWTPWRRTRLRWVQLVRTQDRRFNHPTMIAATHGKGAIIASTMFLANTGQLELIEALLSVHGETRQRLPQPPRLLGWIKEKVYPYLLPVVVATAAGFIFKTSVSARAMEYIQVAMIVLVFVGALVGSLVFRRLSRTFWSILGR